jgi:cobalt-zinc-cadmium efflux system outer membrane protein
MGVLKSISGSAARRPNGIYEPGRSKNTMACLSNDSIGSYLCRLASITFNRRVSMGRYFRFLILLSSLLYSYIAAAQAVDTVRVTFPQVEEIFLRNNYSLLAQRYSIGASEGAIRQARLWNNPLFFVESNLYNPVNGKFFDYGPVSKGNTDKFNWPDGKPINGTISMQLNQLLLLAGKRSKMVHLAEDNKDIQLAIFTDLLRSLHYALYQAFILLHYDIESISILREEESQLVRLISIEEIALSKGAVSGYEVTRLQFELQDIRKSIKEQQDEEADDENSLRTVLNADPFTFYLPVLPKEAPEPTLFVTQLVDSALSNRPEMKIIQYNLDYNRTNVSLQKAYSVPDLTIGGTYDRSGNAYYNYTGVNLAFNLPLFNRNQGNIRVADQQFQQTQIQQKQTEFNIKEDVVKAYQKWQNSLQQKNLIKPEYEQNLQDISQSATDSYNKRTIGLLDYLDKIKTARNAQLNLFNLQQSLSLSRENINFITNSKVFK